MVARRKPYLPVLLVVVLSIVLLPRAPIPVRAQSIRYHLEHQYTKIWVNEDGSIDLFYDIEIACDSERITRVWIGQPNEDFALGEAFDEDGNALEIFEDFEEDPSVRVMFHTPIGAGESLRFNLTTNVQGMVWLDEDNPGNVGLQFIPTWWGETVEELRVLIVLPEGAVQDEVRNTPDWDNIFPDEETGRLVLYWERKSLAPNQKFTVGVSFPKELVEQYETKRSGWGKILYGFLLFVLPVIVVIIIIVLIIRFIRNALKKRPYSRPRIRMETLGAKRGLTAVEAAWLLGLGPVKVVVAILYSLLRKRAVWVSEREPKLKLEVQTEFRDGTGTRETPLRYYEHRFINSIEKDGTLDEDGLASAVILVRDTVEQKMRGYNRQDTIQHYQSIVDKAWSQVEAAGTPELMSEAFDEQLLWLYLDGDFEGKIKGTMEDRVFVPSDDMWWYWWWTRPHPTPPSPSPTAEPKPPQPLPGGEFADKIVTTMEESANKLVANVENFANSIAPAPPPKVRRVSVRRGSGGSCACASCACACACVSCACACAGGRVG
jgi:hypothetical protein